MSDETAKPRRGIAALGGSQFLIAQIFTIASTIIGVYLAGYVGFQRTLEYDRLQTARQQLNLFTALQAELNDNVTRLSELSERMHAANEEGKGIWGDWPTLRLYVWEAAAENPALFQGPPELVTGIQAFYAETGDLLSDETLHKNFSSLTTSNAYDRNQAKEKFDGLLEDARSDLNNLLGDAIDRPSQLTAAYDADNPDN
ncbi:MAG: hypothetical protein KTR21_00790 [Rhodobacteraceae bacterium]|nr:hypothetical protein [Paracoccaceae bacterium]